MIQFIGGIFISIFLSVVVLANDHRDVQDTQKKLDIITEICKNQNSKPGKFYIFHKDATCANGFEFNFSQVKHE